MLAFAVQNVMDKWPHTLVVCESRIRTRKLGDVAIIVDETMQNIAPFDLPLNSRFTRRNSTFSCSTSFNSKLSVSPLIRNRAFHCRSSPWLNPNFHSTSATRLPLVSCKCSASRLNSSLYYCFFSIIRMLSFSLLYFTRRDSHTPFYLGTSNLILNG